MIYGSTRRYIANKTLYNFKPSFAKFGPLRITLPKIKRIVKKLTVDKKYWTPSGVYRYSSTETCKFWLNRTLNGKKGRIGLSKFLNASVGEKPFILFVAYKLQPEEGQKTLFSIKKFMFKIVAVNLS